MYACLERKQTCGPALLHRLEAQEEPASQGQHLGSATAVCGGHPCLSSGSGVMPPRSDSSYSLSGPTSRSFTHFRVRRAWLQVLLLLGFIQMILGILIVTFSLLVTTGMPAHKSRSSCPIWAGFPVSLLVRKGEGCGREGGREGRVEGRGCPLLEMLVIRDYLNTLPPPPMNSSSQLYPTFHL